MKNSKEYGNKVRKLYNSLKLKYGKVDKIDYADPIDALIYAIVGSKNTEKSARSMIRKLNSHFVDWNDLRVSRTDEIVEIFGGDNKENRTVASNLMTVLGWVFNKYDMVSLDSLREIGKRPARAVLEKMDAVSPFVVDYVILTALQGHCIPLTDKMIEYLRGNELVHPEADRRDIEGFLTRHITASNGYWFYALLRHESESGRGGKKKATASKKAKKTKKKTKK